MEKNTNLSESYRVQSGCYNCKHVFVRMDYDEGDELYCEKVGGKHPACGSSSLKEEFSTYGNMKIFNTNKKMWEQWKNKYNVEHLGLCDQYQPETESDTVK